MKSKVKLIGVICSMIIQQMSFFTCREWENWGWRGGGRQCGPGETARQDILGGQVELRDVFMQRYSGRVWSKFILEYRAWGQFNNKTKNRKISNKNKPAGKVKDAIFY